MFCDTCGTVLDHNKICVNCEKRRSKVDSDFSDQKILEEVEISH